MCTAQIWIPQAIKDGYAWALLPLRGSHFRFTTAAPYLRSVDPKGNHTPAPALYQANGDGGAGQWLVFALPGSGLCVNGQPPCLGVRLLRDRDEIRIPTGQRLYFSTEQLPRVVPFPGADHEIFCARCRMPIQKGDLAVRCPNCGTWCHQSDELPCWTYAGTTHCPLCDQSNDLNAGFRWTPEGLSNEC